MAVHEGFRTTTGGLRDCFPLRLYHKATRLGAWDPAAVGLTQDRRDWESLGEPQRETVLSLTSLYNYHESLAANGLMPGRLVAEDPAVRDVVEARMQELFPYALGVVTETFAQYEDGVTPFGLQESNREADA